MVVPYAMVVAEEVVIEVVKFNMLKNAKNV